jgi:hypothetical protein
MPSPTPFNPTFRPSIPSVANKPEDRRKRGQRKTARPSKKTSTTITGCVSQATRSRLLSEAIQFYVSIDPSVLQAWIDVQLQRLLEKLPWWHGRTESADAVTRRNRRRYQVEHGQIEKQVVPAGLAEWQRRQRELCLEDGLTAEETINDETNNQEETTERLEPSAV